MKGNGLILAGFLLASNLGFSAAEPTYEQAVDRLVVLSGSSATEMIEPFVRMFSNGLAQHMAASVPDFGPDDIQIISDEVALYMHEQFLLNKELRQLQYDAYKQYFSKQELLELIDFYHTPLGRKFLSDMPFLMQYVQTGVGKVLESITNNMEKDLVPRLEKRFVEKYK